MTSVLIGHGARRVAIGGDLPLTLIAGPCALESADMGLKVAEELARLGERLKIGVVFKASFDKANRTSGEAARGVGFDAALPIFAEIKEKTGLPITTDVHEAWQCARVAEVVDLLVDAADAVFELAQVGGGHATVFIGVGRRTFVVAASDDQRWTHTADTHHP